MRHLVPALLLLSACDPLTPCTRPADEWCFHEEGAGGPVYPEPGAKCAPPDLEGQVEACGRYDVTGYSGGYTSQQHYFLDGLHVATQYTTDVNVYCGDFDFWYGRPIDCD